MMEILYAVIAFLAGLIIAWLIKQSQATKDRLSNATLQNQLAALEAERNIATKNNLQLQDQAARMQEQLRMYSADLAEKNARMEGEMNALQILRVQYSDVLKQLNEANTVISNLDRQKSHADAELKYKDEQLKNQQAELEKIGQKFESEFKVLAQNILNEKSKTFAEEQEKSLTNILTPLKENILLFKTEIESRYNKESEERISLREQIKHITETNRLLSDQANNLTNALRGQVKQQGNWGEMILESILEHAGLNKDLHYFVQEQFRDDEGKAFLPDVIVKYPDGRNIVIDSKVSLKNYEEYSSSDNVDAQKTALQLLVRSIYSHIDNLSSKDYQQKANALDFVMLFVPAEGAYITAMQADTGIWQYAYNKKVLLISPTNLIAAMKLVYDLWKKDGISNNANAIAEKAVKIYEKLAAFVEDFEKVGMQLNKATATFNDAQKKLHTGKGNLLSQANQMKAKLGHNKPSRDLPAGLLEQAMLEEELGGKPEDHEDDV